MRRQRLPQVLVFGSVAEIDDYDLDALTDAELEIRIVLRIAKFFKKKKRVRKKKTEK